MRPVTLPAAIEAALDNGAALAVSISGGKDSQAMALALAKLHRERGWTGEIFAIHADLGDIEWPESAAHVRRIAELAGIRLQVVRRSDGRGMIEHWEKRGARLEAQGKQGRPWSDAKNRFCTSDMKRDPIDSYLRRYKHVVCAVGIRAQESTSRAKQPEWQIRSRISAAGRRAFTWHPILHWNLIDVLRQCGHTWGELRMRQEAYAAGAPDALNGWTLHPAYVYGNERLSCQFCVLGSLNDLRTGAKHRPDLLERLVGIENRFGFTFQQNRSLATFRQAA